MIIAAFIPVLGWALDVAVAVATAVATGIASTVATVVTAILQGFLVVIKALASSVLSVRSWFKAATSAGWKGFFKAAGSAFLTSLRLTFVKPVIKLASSTSKAWSKSR